MIFFARILRFVLVFFQMHPDEGPHLSLVVSPLRSLIMDQVTKAKKMGVKAVGVLSKEELNGEDMEGKKTFFLQTYPLFVYNNRNLHAQKQF